MGIFLVCSKVCSEQFAFIGIDRHMHRWWTSSRNFDPKNFNDVRRARTCLAEQLGNVASAAGGRLERQSLVSPDLAAASAVKSQAPSAAVDKFAPVFMTC